MKGIYSRLVFVILLLWCCWQPARTQSGDLRTFSYDVDFEKGKVQYIYVYHIVQGKKEFSWEAVYDSAGNRLSARSYTSGELRERDTSVYDRWGNRVEYYIFYARDISGVDDPQPSYSAVKKYDSLGKPVMEEIQFSRDIDRITYTYDDTGRLIARKYYVLEDQNYVLTDAHEYSPDTYSDTEIHYYRDRTEYATTTKKYDATGKLVRKYILQTGTASTHIYTYNTRYIYDKYGNLTGSIHGKKKNRTITERFTERYICNDNDSAAFTVYRKGPRGKHTSKKIYRFNDHHQVTEYHYWVADSLVEKETSQYDTLQRRLLYARYDHRGMIYREENIYDDLRLVKQVRSGNDGEKEVRHTYIYTYDAAGNWVQLEMYLNDEPFRTVQREIRYFE